MQNPFDPFRAGDHEDRTVFIPMPGGRRRGGAAAEAPARGYLPVEERGGAPLPAGVGANPLLKSAASLFALVRQLRSTPRHDDIHRLRDDVIAALQQFDADTRAAGVDAKAAAQAGYALCALIDEAVLGTPWGLNSSWSQQSLSITFYKENVAGEHLFGFLERARELPQQNLDLLEFFYVCLSQGFEGRYRLEPGGLDRLSRIRADLYEAIRRERGEPTRELSPRWRGVIDRRPALSRYMPLWVTAAAAAAVVLLVFLVLNLKLNEDSDRVYAEIASLIPQSSAWRAPAVPSKPDGLAARLRVTLAPEIRESLVDVRDLGQSVSIILFNRGLFPRGGAEVGSGFLPVVRKVGLFIQDNELRGPITVVGHTDNLPIRTLRFPSNWHLSEARAEAVVRVLESNVPATTLRAVGRADGEPIASNDSEAGRSQNRRVEIRIAANADAAARPK
jgi:type VI secretion system protein ImpK